LHLGVLFHENSATIWSMRAPKRKPIGKNTVIEVQVDPTGKSEAEIKALAEALAQAEVQKTFFSDMSVLMKDVKLKQK
jgi:hypothetical protein